MEKLELYHLHKLGSHDKKWHENAIITVNDNFKNTMYERYKNFNTSIPMEDGGSINLHDLIIFLKLQIIYRKII